MDYSFILAPIIGLSLIVAFVYLASRIAHFFNNTRNKIEELDRKIDELKELIINNK